MSLAGKILTVFVTLVLLAWIYLFASVAQLNRNWGQAIANEKNRFEEQSAKLVDLEKKIVAAHSNLLRERNLTDAANIALRQTIEDYQYRLAEEREALSRIQIHFDSEKQLNALSQSAAQRRAQERAKLQEDLAKLQTEIVQLEMQDAELLSQVTDLLMRFQSLLAQNQELVRQRTGQPASTSSSTNPVSLTR